MVWQRPLWEHEQTAALAEGSKSTVFQGRKIKKKKKKKAASEELTCTRPVWTRGGTCSPPNQSTEKGMREAGEAGEEDEEEKIRADTSGVRGRTEAAWGQSRTLSLLTYFYQHTHTHTHSILTAHSQKEVVLFWIFVGLDRASLTWDNK